MKRFRFTLLALTCFCFSSCLEISDVIEIADDGSGKMSFTMDLSQLADMMKAMGGEEFEKKAKEKIDEEKLLKDEINEDKLLTKDEKKLLSDGKLSVKMNLEEKLYKIGLQFPFKDQAGLNQLSNILWQKNEWFENKMDKTMGGEGKEGGEGPSMARLLGLFDYSISKGSISRTVNLERLKAMEKEPSMKEISDGEEMGIEIKQSVTYKLPSPAKKVSNSNATLSDDKKTVTLTANMMKIFSDPEQFDLKITY